MKSAQVVITIGFILYVVNVQFSLIYTRIGLIKGHENLKPLYNESSFTNLEEKGTDPNMNLFELWCAGLRDNGQKQVLRYRTIQCHVYPP